MIPPHVADAVAEEIVRQATERPYYGQSVERTATDARDAAYRALAVGAEPPLTFTGMGMTGTVLCDARQHAFKASRHRMGIIEDEAAWLETASTVPGVREHVARFIQYHPVEDVLERECVREVAEPRGTWGVDVAGLHEKMARQMRARDWGAPEYKTDSYVETDRGPVLVDAGFALRHGERFVRYVEDVLAGRRPWRHDKPEDLAWALRMEFPEVSRPTHVEALLVELARAGHRAPRP